MPLGRPAVPGAGFSVAGFASGTFELQPRNGPIPVLDGPQRVAEHDQAAKQQRAAVIHRV